MICKWYSTLFQEVPAGFLSRPLVGINRTALYGDSMHYGSCTAFQDGYRPVHNTTQNNALRYVVFASTLVEKKHDARIDSNPILAFLCVAFLRLVKNPDLFLVINLCISRINATRGIASLCEPTLPKNGASYSTLGGRTLCSWDAFSKDVLFTWLAR